MDEKISFYAIIIAIAISIFALISSSPKMSEAEYVEWQKEVARYEASWDGY